MEPGSALVELTSVIGSFHANVLVARLRAEGIAAQRLGASDGPYPLPAEIAVLVPEKDLQVAREILLADAVDAAFISPQRRVRAPRWGTLKRREGR